MILQESTGQEGRSWPVFFQSQAKLAALAYSD